MNQDAAQSRGVRAGEGLSTSSIVRIRNESDMPAIGKWPRAFRLLLILGSSLLLWVLILAIVRWI